MKKAIKNNSVKKKQKTKKTKVDTRLTFETKSLGQVKYSNNTDLNIIKAGDALLTAVRGIYNTYIPNLAKALVPYVKSSNILRTSKSGGMPEAKKHCWKLFGYETKDSETGLNTKNESFERNVARAVKLALAIVDGKSKLVINKNNKIVGMSKRVEPMLRVTNAKGKKMKPIKNTSNELIGCTIANMERIFAEDILKQKSDNRKGKNKGANLTKSNVNVFTFDAVLKAVSVKLVDLNLMEAEKLVSKVKGEQLARLKNIAKDIALILAKLETCQEEADGKVKTSNKVLFDMQDKARSNLVTKHFNKAVFSIKDDTRLENIK